jgi:lipopolysaccharide exporter
MKDISQKMATGAAWMVLSKILDRTIGFISTIILARLLVPSDFGLAAMATAIIAMLQLFGAFSFDVALIQNQNAERRHYDTVWTMELIFAAICAISLLALAHPAAVFYNEPRLTAIMQVLAIGTFIRGFTNVGVVAFQKEMQFGNEFKFVMSKRIITFVVTITLAVLWKDYWALVVGTVAATSLGVVISYLSQQYRPRLCLAAWRELFHFSKWMLAINLLNFLHHRSVDFIIGKISGTRVLGLYNIAYEISNLATTEMVAPITRATFPGYVKLAGNMPALRAEFLNVSSMIALIAVPIGVGIAATSDLIVGLVLGPQWVDASPLIAILAFYGVIQSLQSNAGAVFLAMGKTRATARILALYVAVLIPALIWGAHRNGSLGVAIATLAVGVAMAPVNLDRVFRVTDLRTLDYIKAVWRPLAAALVMYYAVDFVHKLWPTQSFIDQAQMALACATVGVITYALFILGLWKLSSCPAGAEEYVLRKLHMERIIQVLKGGGHSV